MMTDDKKNKKIDYDKRIEAGLVGIITLAELMQENKNLKELKSIIRIAKAQLRNLEERK